MAINDVTLAGGMRNNLASLQLVAALQARTTERLATGKRVNSAVDDPSAYFAAQNHRDRAGDLAARKDQMGEAIQTVRAALQGIDGIVKLIEQAKGTASAEGARIVAAAQQQIELDTTRAKESLRREVAGIAVGAASKLLGREIDARAHADLLEQLAEEI